MLSVWKGHARSQSPVKWPMSTYRQYMWLFPFYHTSSLPAKVGTGSLEDISRMVEQITAFPSPHPSGDKEVERQQDLPSSCQHHVIFLGEQRHQHKKKDYCLLLAPWMGDWLGSENIFAKVILKYCNQGCHDKCRRLGCDVLTDSYSLEKVSPQQQHLLGYLRNKIRTSYSIW